MTVSVFGASQTLVFQGTAATGYSPTELPNR